MGRRIVTEQQLESTLESAGPSATATLQGDGYWDKVIKYIPGDVVAGWTAILGLFGTPPGAQPQQSTTVILWVLLLGFIGLTAFWTFRQTTVIGQPPARTQIIIATAAFIVWALALGAPFNTLSFYDPRLAAALLIVYTLVVGRISPSE